MPGTVPPDSVPATGAPRRSDGSRDIGPPARKLGRTDKVGAGGTAEPESVSGLGALGWPAGRACVPQHAFLHPDKPRSTADRGGDGCCGLLGPQHAGGRSDRIGCGAVGGHHRDRRRARHAQARPRIDDMAVTPAGDLHRLKCVTGCRHRSMAQEQGIDPVLLVALAVGPKRRHGDLPAQAPGGAAETAMSPEASTIAAVMP